MVPTVQHDRPRPWDAVMPVMRCADCGLALGPAALRDNRALVLAAVCPRCDGTLVDVVRTPDPSVYLG